MKVNTVKELIEALSAMPQEAIAIGLEADKDGVSVIEQDGSGKVLIVSPAKQRRKEGA